MFELPTPDSPIQWIANLSRPTWDQFFMAQTFLTGMRSNDAQTKQGAIIVDWSTKIIIGGGYNAHPRGCRNDLPTMRHGSVKYGELQGIDGIIYRVGDCLPKGEIRDAAMAAYPEQIQGDPDKYKYMCHCETNALLQLGGAVCDFAVIYVPMPSCDMCAGYVVNHPKVKVRRIVYYEDRAYDNKIYAARPDVKIEKYSVADNGEPFDLLIQAAQYAKLRRDNGQEISKTVGLTYRNAT